MMYQEFLLLPLSLRVLEKQEPMQRVSDSRAAAALGRRQMLILASGGRKDGIVLSI